MIKKKDLDKLLTLVRKWHKEKDPELSQIYSEQIKVLSREIAAGTSLAYEEPIGNRLFLYAWHIAQKRWPNEQFYIMIERAGEQVDNWEYRGHFI